jgi:ABC-type lipoprotein release transport system permease subunit
MLRSFNSLALRQLRTRPLRSVLTAFGVVLAATLPARRAARLKVIEALTYE